MTKRKAPPPRRRLRPMHLGLVLVSIVLVTAVAVFLSVRDLSISDLFYRRTRTGGSQSILTAMEDLSRLETLAYIRRSVFPHDYLSPDIEMTELVRTITRHGGRAEEALTPLEYAHYRAANLASHLGMAVRRDQGGYVVVTSIYRFGYDVETLTTYLRSTEKTESAKTADILGALPPGVLLEIEIEALSRETYPYGPVKIDAEGWRRITAFVADIGLPDAVFTEMAERSRDQAIQILRRIIPES